MRAEAEADETMGAAIFVMKSTVGVVALRGGGLRLFFSGSTPG